MNKILRRVVTPNFVLILVSLMTCAGVSTLAQAQIKIMPLGDSITAGAGADAPADVNQLMGYRPSLFNQLQFDFRFVGSQSNGPADLPYLNHEGHGGYRIDQIRASIDDWLTQNPADVVLLEIGTNDIWQGMDAGADARLQDLITQIQLDLPAAIVVVAEITPMSNQPGINDRVTAFNQKIKTVVANLRAAGQAVYLANMNSGIDPRAGGPDLSADGVHPRQPGYAKMGYHWAAALNRLNKFGLIPNAGSRPAYSPAFVVPFTLPLTGQIDKVGDGAVWGWTCAYGVNQFLQADVYVGGPFGVGQMLGRVNATAASEPAVAASCGITGANYRFIFRLNADQMSQASGLPVYVYGLSPNGSGASLLNGSGQFYF